MYQEEYRILRDYKEVRSKLPIQLQLSQGGCMATLGVIAFSGAGLVERGTSFFRLEAF
jgi:hypothetical protein